MGLMITGEFRSLKEELFRLDIDSSQFTGSAVIVENFGTEPIVIKWKKTDSSIKASEATITILSEEILPVINDLIKVEIPDTTVKLYKHNGVDWDLEWKGYMAPYDYEYVYGDNNLLEFTALDDLAILKDKSVEMENELYSIREIIEYACTIDGILPDFSSIVDTFTINNENVNLLELRINVVSVSLVDVWELVEESLYAINARIYQLNGVCKVYRNWELSSKLIKGYLGDLALGASELLLAAVKEYPIKLITIGGGALIPTSTVWESGYEYYSSPPTYFGTQFLGLNGLSYSVAGTNNYEYLSYEYNDQSGGNHTDYPVNKAGGVWGRNNEIVNSQSCVGTGCGGVSYDKWKKDCIVTNKIIKFEKYLYLSGGDNHLGIEELTSNPSSLEHLVVNIIGSTFFSGYGTCDSTNWFKPTYALFGVSAYMAMQIELKDNNGDRFTYTRQIVPATIDPETGAEIPEYWVYFWKPKLKNISDNGRDFYQIMDDDITGVSETKVVHLKFIDLGKNDGDLFYAAQEFSDIVALSKTGTYTVKIFAIESSIIEEDTSELYEDSIVGSTFYSRPDCSPDPDGYYFNSGWIALTKFGVDIQSNTINNNLIAINKSKISGEVGEDKEIRFTSHPGIGYASTVLGFDSFEESGDITVFGKTLLEWMSTEILQHVNKNVRVLRSVVLDNDLSKNEPFLNRSWDYDGFNWVTEEITRDYRNSTSEVELTLHDNNSSNNVDYWEIWYGTDINVLTLLDTVNGDIHDYHITGLTEGTEYFVLIKKFDNEGVSYESNTIIFNTALTSASTEPYISIPSQLKLKDGSLEFDRYILQWTPVYDADLNGYLLYKNGSSFSFLDKALNEQLLLGFSENDSNYWNVAAIGDSGPGGLSNTVTVVNPAEPAEPDPGEPPAVVYAFTLYPANDIGLTDAYINWDGDYDDIQIIIDEYAELSGTSTSGSSSGSSGGTSPSTPSASSSVVSLSWDMGIGEFKLTQNNTANETIIVNLDGRYLPFTAGQAHPLTGELYGTSAQFSGNVLGRDQVTLEPIVLGNEFVTKDYSDLNYALIEEIAFTKYGSGFIPQGRDNTHFGTPGFYAFDLSYADGTFSAVSGATGSHAIASGWNVIASGYASLVLGEISEVSGTYSIVTGYDNEGSGYSSFTTGAYNRNPGNYNWMGAFQISQGVVEC